MAGDTKDPGPDINVPDPFALMLERLHDQAENMGRIAESVSGDGQEIVMLTAAAVGTSFQSQHVRLRVRTIVFSRATAGLSSLIIGGTQYPFTLPAAPVQINFPIVIERGYDMQLTGDGVAYLIGNPE